MDRQKRLTELLEYLMENGDNENGFEAIYKKLLSEIEKEFNYNSDMNKNLYLNNLRQTQDKQAANYTLTKQKRANASCYKEFKEFVSNFKDDVVEGLSLGVNPTSD